MTSSTKTPNIVLIMSDEQRWDSIGANGNPAARTPHLDELAGSGMSLDRCFATYPLCCPSRMSIWTGQMPHAHWGFGNWRALNPALRNGELIRAFREQGYGTIYNGKWHVPGTTPGSFGFEDVEATPAVIKGQDRGRYIEDYRAYATSKGYDLVPGNIENLTPHDVATLDRPGKAPYGTSEIPAADFLETWQTGVFLDQLDRRDPDRPFFSVCSFNAPHFPMIVPKPYDTLIDPGDVQLSPNQCQPPIGKPEEVTASSYRHADWSENEWRNLIAHYFGLCALIDEQVGRIVSWLDELGLRESTIVVFTSDHGDMLGSHQLNKKGYPLHYEETLRVPCIAAGPGIPRGERSAALMSLMDLLPTIAGLCGVDMPAKTEGVDCSAVWQGRDTAGPREYVIAESFLVNSSEGGDGSLVDPAGFDPRVDSLNVSIRTQTWRYIWRQRDCDELYNLDNDPFELDNLVADNQSMASGHDLRSILTRYIARAIPNLAEQSTRC